MPVSHLALTVSHIPSATSFYLAALQPLGYRYIGQQGDSIGLGVTDADFFLTQQQNGYRTSPTHVAFSAEDTCTVRDCYAAALNAGGSPSGAPTYRNGNCSCFNAAVIDPDGNTIEFILRQKCNTVRGPPTSVPSHYNQGQPWQNDASRVNDMQSMASRTRSRGQTAMDVASAASRSMQRSDAPAPGMTRSKTEPIASTTNGGNAVVGTLLGAAAGAAFAFTMFKSERESARDEAVYASSMRSKAPSFRSERPRSSSFGKSIGPQTTKSARSSRKSMRAIEPAPYRQDDLLESLSRHTISNRPAPSMRSRTYDAIEYAPTSRSKASRSDKVSIKRSSTLPLEMPTQYYLEGPKSTSSSRRRSPDELKLERYDSGVSMGSHHSRRKSESKASTVKASRRGSLYESVAEVPLPASRATSRYAPSKTSHRSSPSAAHMPLPQSRATSYVSAAQVPVPPSDTNSRYTIDPAEESDGLGDCQTVVPDDSISCVDFSEKAKKSKSDRKSSSSKRSQASTVRRARPTASRHSARTAPPERAKDEFYRRKSSRMEYGRMSAATYA